MSQLCCDICGNQFTTKTGLKSHKQRKNPCKPSGSAISPSPAVPPFNEFREISKKFNTSLSKEIRQEQGIFFTPKKIRDSLFSKLAELHVQPKTILEPSFGSGEFILDARHVYPHAKITGIEKNEELFNSTKCPEATLICCDFLEWSGTAELIIGNPPYFVIKTDKLSAKEKKEFAAKHSNVMTGRPNIYIIFLFKCLTEHLDKNCFLAFIIPTSLYNCSYYQPMRDYIYKNTTIKYVETLNKPGFYETGQETMLIILQKNKYNDDYIFIRNSNIFISPHYRELYELTKNTKTIAELDLGVKTGNIVWNQHKDNLTDNHTEGTLLIYSSNINNCELTLNNLRGGQKKQYIKDIKKPTISGPVILVDRGYGNSYNFNYVFTNLKNFYAENHMNIIYPKTVGPESEANLQKIVKSFQDKRSQQFIEWFIGNGCVSSTDLETIVPIF